MTDYELFVAYLESIGGDIDELNEEYLKKFNLPGITEEADFLKSFLEELPNLLIDPAYANITNINKKVAKSWGYFLSEDACCCDNASPTNNVNRGVNVGVSSALGGCYSSCGSCCNYGGFKW